MSRKWIGLGGAFAELAAADDLVARQVLAGVRKALFERDDDPVKVDRFVIVERVGAGAMGVVYAAYDPKLDRKVALKVLATSEPDARRRALREARALARLSDPHVVAIHDAGEFDGHVWVAMELVEGTTLDRFTMPTTHWSILVQRYTAAARGLAAAHDAGIVHRDFKPTNVMVGDDGRVRVLDFGLAHLGAAAAPAGMIVHCDESANESTGRFGQPGTVAFMAPEQLEGRDPDARADQFAFCVSLYAAIYGRHPFAGTTPAVLLAHMHDGALEFPPRPRVPAWLIRLLRRGLALDPADRHPDMRAIVEVLERHRDRKSRRAIVGIAVAVVGASLAYAVGHRDICASAADDVAAIWHDDARARIEGSFRATELPYADLAWVTARDGLNDYARELADLRVTACEAPAHRDAARTERHAQCLDGRMRALAQVVNVLGDAEAEVVQHAAEIVAGLPELQLCAHESVLASALPVPDSDADRVRIAAVRDDIAAANALESAGRYAHADALASEALASANAIGYAPAIAEASTSLGTLRELQGDGRAAERLLRDALLLAETHDHIEIAALAATRLTVLFAQDPTRTERAQEMADRCWALLVRAGAPERRVVDYIQAQRLIHTHRGEYDEALEWSERAFELDDDALRLAIALSGHGTLLDRLGRTEDALVAQQRALELVRGVKGPEHPQVAVLLLNVGNALLDTNEPERARVSFEQAREIFERELGVRHDNVAEVLSSLALAHEALGDRARAIESAEAAIRIFDENGSAYLAAGPRYNLGSLLLKNGEPERAMAQFEAAHRSFVEQGPEDAPDAVYTLHGIGEALLAMDRPLEAIERLDAALALAERHGEAPQLRALVETSLRQARAAAGRQ